MNLEQAKAILKDTVRSELRDHAFGDREIYWYDRQTEEIVASGYCGRSCEVVFCDGFQMSFQGDDAQALLTLGHLGNIERNDSTEPDQYEDGSVMPGLMLEGVRTELTMGDTDVRE